MYPDAEPGDLTLLRAQAVCNDAFAYLCVHSKLQQIMSFHDPNLLNEIIAVQDSEKGKNLFYPINFTQKLFLLVIIIIIILIILLLLLL